MDALKKGQRVKITGNSIFEMMGFKTMTGSVYLVLPTSFAIKCDQTGAIETCDYDDGELTIEL